MFFFSNQHASAVIPKTSKMSDKLYCPWYNVPSSFVPTTCNGLRHFFYKVLYEPDRIQFSVFYIGDFIAVIDDFTLHFSSDHY